MKFNWKRFGKELRETREAYGFGLRETARALKIHHATFCRAEQGKPITAPIYVFLCEWMTNHPADFALRHPGLEVDTAFDAVREKYRRMSPPPHGGQGN